jgi:hypothetical protein
MPEEPPETIVAIVDAENGLSEEDARVLERMLWSHVSADIDFTLVNGVPDGAPIDVNRYGQLTLFASEIVLALRQSGLMFLNGSVRERLAGPRAEPNRIGPPRRLSELRTDRTCRGARRRFLALATRLRSPTRHRKISVGECFLPARSVAPCWPA